MTFREGLYKVEFSTQGVFGSGVVTLLGGKVRGGDSSLYYIGSYELNGETFKAEVSVSRHTQGLQSVFGVDRVTLKLSGRLVDDNGALEGRTKEVPVISFLATLRKIAD